jgi:glucan phosphoethanolaminetransferase (alkaline phosphatase superfamily)
MKKILNILLGVILLITVILTVYAMVAGGSNEAINLNLIWSYILIAVGIATALFTAVWGMVNSSKGIKGTLLSTLLIIVIVADRPRTYDRNSGRRERRLLPAS